MVDEHGTRVPGSTLALVEVPGYPPFGKEVLRQELPVGHAQLRGQSDIEVFVYMHSRETPRFSVAAWAPGRLASVAVVADPYAREQLRIALWPIPADALETRPRSADDIGRAAREQERVQRLPSDWNGRCPITWSGAGVHVEDGYLVGQGRIRSVTRRHDYPLDGVARYRETFQLEVPGWGNRTVRAEFSTSLETGDRVWVCVNLKPRAFEADLAFIAALPARPEPEHP